MARSKSTQSENTERWSDPPLFVLSSLAGGEKHGYAMVADILETTGVHLGPGTLYGAIARLEEQGLIIPLAAQGRRRPYRITAAGRRALEAQLTTIDAVARVGFSRLRAAGAA